MAVPLILVPTVSMVQADEGDVNEAEAPPTSSNRFRNRMSNESEGELGPGKASVIGWKEPRVTQRGFMDLSFGGKPGGRLVFSLYGDQVPETVKNFASLLTGDNEGGLTYKGTEIYRVLSGLNIQMGAIGSANGRTGQAAGGKPFPQENFDIPHRAEGMLSMAKDLDGNSDSRFFINVKEDAGWADGRYVAYGRVAEGMDVMKKIEAVKVTGGSNKPVESIVVENCGLLDD
ncbi:unnamed protein product [Choristocarpus tenellus]